VSEAGLLHTSLRVGLPIAWQPGQRFYHCSDIDYGAVAEVARSYGHKRAVMARPPDSELDPIRLGVAARPRAPVGMSPEHLRAAMPSSNPSPEAMTQATARALPPPLGDGPDLRQARQGKRLAEFPLEL